MGSDMWKQHLKSANQYLVFFQNEQKKIEGRTITEWFRLGEKIFIELYKLGDSIEWKYSEIEKAFSGVSNLIAYFTKNQEWLQTFVNIYPTLRIDLDVVGSPRDICMVRSGVEVLLRGFINIDTRFDRVLKDLEVLGEVDELDRYLKIWRDSGHRPDFASGDKPSKIPEHHWWWQ